MLTRCQDRSFFMVERAKSTASIFADGGRVLTITALGSDLANACERAYAASIA